MTIEPFNLKQFLYKKLSRRITFLFLLAGIVAPAIGMYYFYLISTSTLTQNTQIFAQQTFMLQTTAAIIISLIAVDLTIIGFFLSQSITKPIKELHDVALEVQKGNFTAKAKITTEDEIAELGHAINQGITALEKIDIERKQLDKAKSEFLSMISHELRTPITPLKVQLQMLQEEYFGKLTDKQKESLDVIVRNTGRLNKIIEDFLEISRIEAARLKFNFRKTDLKQTVKETVGLLEGFAQGKKISLVTQIPQLPLIEVDPDRVSQVLRNLVHNAIKYSHPNSKIEISTTPQRDHIVFSVKDYGAGMSPEDQLRVFEPFYQIEETSSRPHGGTGLGLAICRGIVESQKGKIWVESRLDHGSTFSFTIPLMPVRDIEPIKVLFSPKTVIERKIEEAFKERLGPMGIVEFTELKNKNSLGKNDIYEYIGSVENMNIISNKTANDFRFHIGKIFGDETLFMVEDQSRVKKEIDSGVIHE